MSDEKEDKGYVVMGPELKNGGRAAIRVNKEGVCYGEMFKPGTIPDAYKDGELSRIETKPISSSIYEVVKEEPIGRPAMVNSKCYRDNWDNIFGNKQVVGES